ncbi:hypothetical protein [Streptomyces sp. NPDC004050]
MFRSTRPNVRRIRAVEQCGQVRWRSQATLHRDAVGSEAGEDGDRETFDRRTRSCVTGDHPQCPAFRKELRGERALPAPHDRRRQGDHGHHGTEADAPGDNPPGQCGRVPVSSPSSWP